MLLIGKYHVSISDILFNCPILLNFVAPFKESWGVAEIYGGILGWDMPMKIPSVAVYEIVIINYLFKTA